MSKKYSIEDVKRISLEHGIEFIDITYKDNRTLHLYKCPSCNKEVRKSFKDVLNGHILCYTCGEKKRSISKKYSLKEVQELARSVGCEFLDDKYIDYKYKHTFLCSKCKKNTFKRSLNDVLKKDKPRTVCMKCATSSRNDKQKLSENDFNKYKEHYLKNQFIEIISNYEDYINFNTKNLLCHCLICNTVKNMSLNQLKDIESKTGCGCSYISFGERFTLEFLEHIGIKYEYQKLLPNGLYSDFEIKLQSGKVLLLEIDGSQHYIYSRMFHKNYDEFLLQQKNDRIKEQYYLDNGNSFVRIKYENSHGTKNWKNDDIEAILKEIFAGRYGEVKRKNPNKQFSIINIAKYHPSSKKILVYTLDGKFYRKYNSFKECENELKISNLSKERNNNIKCGSYMIRDYVENYPIQIEPYDGKLKEIKVFKKGELLGIFRSIREVSKITGVNRTSISNYLKGRNTKIKDYHFEYNTTSQAS